ncbi:MAG: AAA family ATPase [bacterium]|nr:AAA family ATPase [bacterium]
MNNDVLDVALALAPKVANVAADVAARNIGRESIIRATFLSLVSGRPAFFLGSPGINKTGTVQDVSRSIDGAVFYDALMPTIVSVEQLLVEQTSIEESTDANGIKSIRTRDTLGRAAAAHILFADEIWKAEPRVLQTLLDLSKGDGVRHEGRMLKTPLLAFVAASNELPDPEGNLGAMWSRMTIRAVVNSLDRAGKKSLVAARINRARGTASAPAKLSLEDVEWLREGRPMVEVSDDIVEIVLDLYQQLLDEDTAGFDWLWKDDRRFGRVFDVLQASALLDGRSKVNKSDLKALELLLWDTPEQIGAVKAKVAPLTRTPLSDAQEVVDTLLSPSGTVAEAKAGDRNKLVAALAQFDETEHELDRLAGEVSGDEKSAILVLRKQVDEEKQVTVAAMLGTKFRVKQNN